MLAPWLRPYGGAAVLARPEQHVFGGARRTAETGALPAAARSQWSSPSPPSAAAGG